ncbi:MAG: sulfite exporter TauE/SafE family protein [Cyanobacteria bacterium P01_F01_bin.143]
MNLDFFLIASLGFVGSFGHCAGMCGPLAVSFSLSSQDQEKWLGGFWFHCLLNLGRITSYGLVGIALGSFGDLLFTVQLRQIIGLATGLLLIWLGITRINPNLLPNFPVIHPLQGQLHQKLGAAMSQVASQNKWWTPTVLGLFWGLIPCGFLYVAQITAAETGNIWNGAMIMLAFGLGTMPTMLILGISASRISADRRSQLFLLGGWITLAMGILTLFRTDAMVDYTGHGALALLSLALIARPISHWWSTPLKYRRAIGIGAYAIAIAHILRMGDHTLNWNWQTVLFMLPQHRFGLIMGIIALLLLTPAVFTSTNYWQKSLGKYWRKIHLLSVPALILATMHGICIGSHYLGELNGNWSNQISAIALMSMTIGVLSLRFLLKAKS